MKKKWLLFFIVLLMPQALVKADKIDIQISYGGWTLSPFVSTLENESEDLIRREYTRLMETVIPGYVYSTFLSDVNLSSSGHFYSLGLWYNFKHSRFSAGLKAEYFDFQLPYIIDFEQSIDFLGYQLVSLKTEGEGDVSIKSMTFSLLGRWAALSGNTFKLYLKGGITLFPINGKLFISQNTVIETILGDLTYEGEFDNTLDQIRQWNSSLPSLLISPSLGIQGQLRIMDSVGLFLDVTLSQGGFLSAGLVFFL
jgi:hypothetical protein